MIKMMDESKNKMGRDYAGVGLQLSRERTRTLTKAGTSELSINQQPFSE